MRYPSAPLIHFGRYSWLPCYFGPSGQGSKLEAEAVIGVLYFRHPFRKLTKHKRDCLEFNTSWKPETTIGHKGIFNNWTISTLQKFWDISVPDV